ncbi:hypothetical protein BD410DRAFT_803763 [Rickenella mellea]|uniref:Uncharacterized protein n=1 Tax=Rickenella mellea TaxID=50990 RepID=A0A4Y7Q4T5_9AGAM|nr:hypothetical protein BD410DRAFT_803763 [Rickenella mellea]
MLSNGRSALASLLFNYPSQNHTPSTERRTEHSTDSKFTKSELPRDGEGNTTTNALTGVPRLLFPRLITGTHGDKGFRWKDMQSRRTDITAQRMHSDVHATSPVTTMTESGHHDWVAKGYSHRLEVVNMQCLRYSKNFVKSFIRDITPSPLNELQDFNCKSWRAHKVAVIYVAQTMAIVQNAQLSGRAGEHPGRVKAVLYGVGDVPLEISIQLHNNFRYECGIERMYNTHEYLQ